MNIVATDIDVYLYDRFSEETTIIAGSTRNEYSPQVAGEYVIYESQFSDTNNNLYRYNVATGQSIAIADTDNNETDARVSDLGHVVYEYEYSAVILFRY